MKQPKKKTQRDEPPEKTVLAGAATSPNPFIAPTDQQALNSVGGVDTQFDPAWC